jgi:hypothetical protein
MLYFAIYLAGVAVGLAMMRDPLPSRLAIALVWPLGPIAFVIVVTILAFAAAVLWPVSVLGMLALLGVGIWFLS